MHLEMRKVSSNEEELPYQIMILVVLSPVAVHICPCAQNSLYFPFSKEELTDLQFCPMQQQAPFWVLRPNLS